MKTNKNYEVRYNDVKDKNGTTTICVRFAGKGSDDYLTDAYLPIVVKALKPSTAEIKKYGAWSCAERYAIAEFCRLNLTKWQMVDAPNEALPFVKQLVGKTLWLYFNGAERAWKFYDPDGCIARANKEQYIIKGKLTEAKLDLINDITLKYDAKCYAPHYDEGGNYGDESVHAVYNMKSEI